MTFTASDRFEPGLTSRTRAMVEPAGALKRTAMPRPRAWRRLMRRLTRTALARFDGALAAIGAAMTMGAGAAPWMTSGAGAGSVAGVPEPLSAMACGVFS